MMQTQQLQFNIPPQVELQQPVSFEDAHGRQFPFYIDFINSFDIFQSVLEARFEDMPGFRKVKSLEYAMRDIASRSAIDLSRPWASIFRPGRIIMNMVFQQPDTTKSSTSSCPGCLTANTSVPDGGDLDIIWYSILVLYALPCSAECIQYYISCLQA